MPLSLHLSRKRERRRRSRRAMMSWFAGITNCNGRVITRRDATIPKGKRMMKRSSNLRWCCFAVSAVLAFPLSVSAQQQKAPASPPKLTYDDDVKTIFREHWFTCHNQNQSKGGLALDSFNKAMEGGSSGKVVFPGDLDSSRLWALVSHSEEPSMPPMQPKLADAKL